MLSGACAGWFVLDFFIDRYLPFDVYKRHNIGTVASLLALILAVGAYTQPHRRRGLIHLAVLAAALILAAYVFIVPL